MSGTNASITKMEAEHAALLKELQAGEAEMRAGPISQKRGEELEEKAKRAEELQQHINQYRRIANLAKQGREVEHPTMPADRKAERAKKRIITTPGHLFVLSDQFKGYLESKKQGWSASVDVRTLRDGRVELVGEAAEEFEAKAFDPTTLPVVGTDAIIPQQRDPDVIRYEEPEILNLRSVLDSSGTTSDTIRFVRYTYTRGAASQDGKGALKNFGKISFDVATTPVETIAVLSKVTEQDVDDAPRMISIINGEMRLDVKVEEDRQIAWGNGTDGNLLGLFDPSVGISEFSRAQQDDTLIDTIRRMRTDLRKRRVMPSFVAVDPIDWEQIELEKGTDDRYVWGLISTLRGPQIWSLRVVETDAMTNPDTGERRVLMGDGTRGATVFDRHDVRLAVGYVDDDFARNLRTLRAEERIALAIKRPFAFTYAQTALPGS